MLKCLINWINRLGESFTVDSRAEAMKDMVDFYGAFEKRIAQEVGPLTKNNKDVNHRLLLNVIIKSNTDNQIKK